MPQGTNTTTEQPQPDTKRRFSEEEQGVSRISTVGKS
jgi:hypothetical protein